MTVRVGIAGLGAPSVPILRGFGDVAGVTLAAAADVRPEAREEFSRTHGLPAFEGVEAMARSPLVDAVWVATPSHLHCAHTIIAAQNGKHVICEKPLALSLEECDRMIEAAQKAGVELLLGHSKVLETPIRAMRKIAESGRYGRVIAVDSWLFNDWLQRPRLAAELDTTQGGGVVLRQGPHQADIVRYLGGGIARAVRAGAGRWDKNFATEGNYVCFLEFADGTAGSFSLNGYGHYDIRDLTWGVGVSGRKQATLHAPKPRRTRPLDPHEKYGEAAADSPARSEGAGAFMPFFGLTILGLERAVVRQSPQGLLAYTAEGCEEIAVSPSRGQAAELEELRDALAAGRRVFPDGEWGRATVEVCLAVLQSAREHRSVALSRQVPSR